MKRFQNLYLQLLKEAEGDEEDESAPPVEGQEGEDDSAPPLPGGEGEGLPEEMNMDDIPDGMMGGEELEEEVNQEEIELAKLAVRAIYFNLDSKDVHQYKLKVKDDIIPFENIPDYFEETKNWTAVLAFVEHIMDKFEGTSSKWAEEKEISGKPIIQKLKIINRGMPKEQQLDAAQRLYWTRIILNCILFGKPTENMNIGDINERNLKEIFGWLKLHYGVDTRGITGGKNHRAPGVF
jgi:hypothetical protein